MRACGMRTFEIAEFQDDEKAESQREHLATLAIVAAISRALRTVMIFLPLT